MVVFNACGRRAGPLNLEARTNILKGDKSDINDLGGVDKADSESAFKPKV